MMNEALKERQISDENLAKNARADAHELNNLLVQPVGSTNQRRQNADTNAAAEIPVYLGVLIGTVANVVHNNGIKNIFVDFPGNPSSSPIIAKTVLDIQASHQRQEVTLMFDGGDLDSPIIMGVIQKHESSTKESIASNNLHSGEIADGNIDVELDGETLTFKAKDQIKLECGKASITLTKSGKIILRGEYVMSRSTGVNSIKGGSIQLN